VNSLSQPWTPGPDNKPVYEFLPGDNSRQTHALREALREMDHTPNGRTAISVLDLGCGNGTSYAAFSERSKAVRCVGLDIVDSPEVALRPRKALPFCTYDGIRVPLADDSFDMVYSRQVFEHVRYPENVIAEAYRVLKPGGVFVGSTSQLEPFHSRSLWNYTPYGFCVLLRDAGFKAIQVRPGIDGLTLIWRHCFGYIRMTKLFDLFFRVESFINLALETGLRILGWPVKRRNAIKLSFSGQFCFLGHK